MGVSEISDVIDGAVSADGCQAEGAGAHALKRGFLHLNDNILENSKNDNSRFSKIAVLYYSAQKS